MKTKWIALVLCMVMCLQMVPMSAIAEDTVADAPACNMNCNTELISSHQQSCAVKEYYREIYTSHTAQELYAMKEQLTADAWEFIVSESWNLDSSKALELNTLIQNGSVTEPSEPDETDPTDPADPEGTTVSKEVNGQTISVTGDLPEGAELSVKEVDVREQLDAFGLCESVFAYDIQVLNKDLSVWQPTEVGYVLVEISLDTEAGTPVGLLHTHEGKTTYMGTTVVEENGTILLPVTGFSEFVAFTVDFHYSGVDYSIEGMSSILLSELFTAMGIDEAVSQVTSVTFSDPSLVEVTQQENDWLLTSLQAFDSEETLILNFADGRTVVIDVTDEKGPVAADYNYYYLFGSSGTGSGDSLINEKNGTYGFIMRYAANKTFDWVMNDPITFRYYDANNNLIASDTGNNFYWAEDTGVRFFTENDTLWFHVFSWTRVDQSDDPSLHALQFLPKVGSATRYVDFKTYSTAITLPTAAANLCTVKIDSRVATTTESRIVVVNLNGKEVGRSAATLFPNRGTASDGIIVTEKNKSRYHYTGFTYDDTNNIYYLNFYDYAYNLHYNVNGGTGTIPSQSYGTNSATSYTFSISATKPTKAGYKFLGWADSASATTAQFASGGTITLTGTKGSGGATGGKTQTIYAVWQKLQEYTVSYNSNGGSGAPGNQTKYQDQALTLSSTKPTKTGYSFRNWSGSDGKTYEPGDQYTVNAALTLTAVWDPKTDGWYKVHYYLSGSAESVRADKEQTGLSYGGTYTEIAPTITGYTLISTSTQTVTAGYADNEITFYYMRDTYTVHYDANSGSGAPADQSKTHGVSLTLSNAKPSRDGYTFDSWNTAQNGSGTRYTAGASYTANADVTLYAQWNKISYKITYDTADGPAVEEQSYDITANVTLAAAPIRNGYDFLGWKLASAVNTWEAKTYSASANVGTGKFGNVTLVAQWKRQTGSLTISKSGNVDADQTFIFRVVGQGIDMQVVIQGAGSVTVSELPTGSYTITEDTSWSWRYTPDAGTGTQTASVTDGGEAKLTFHNTKTNSKWFSVTAWLKNFFGMSS